MFGRKSRRPRAPRTNKSTTRKTLRLEALERRDLMSINSLWFSGAMLVVRSDNSASNVEVRQSGANLVIADVGTNRTWSYAAASVSSVEFQGGAGNDRFVDNIANLPVRAFGFGGNDYLEGYNGSDMFDGGLGDDTLVGYGGNDFLYGGGGNDILRGLVGDDQLSGQDGNDRLEGGDGNEIAWGGIGNDVLLGGNGNDQLVGEDGDDRLNGQAGNDKLWGGNGNDVLIAIDAAIADYVQGDAGNDTCWIDQNGSSKDTVSGATSTDKVHNVTGFANGADRTLDGDRIADPIAKSGHVYKQFSGNPLFSSTGPAATDIRQGVANDCYLLSALGAIANDRPAAIGEVIADFDDGTYGVRLGSKFYRVDNDLPVANASSTVPANAALGRENSMWVAAIEKAYAHYRTGANSYVSIDFGWSVEVNRAFNSLTPGEREIQSYASSAALANEIYSRWANYEAVTIGFMSERTPGVGGAPLVMQHMYMVWSVTRNSAGVVTSITLRNPWGVDGAGNDGNTSDGLVTVTPDQILRYTGRVNWGRV